MGFERFVFVKPKRLPSATTAACSMQCAEMPGCRGIVDVDENARDSQLAAMHALGVRGVARNVSPIHPPEAGLAQKLLPRSSGWRRAAPSSAGISTSCCPAG
jgi:hypothetical protein